MDHAFAISLQDQVEKYGAYVGIAAFFGLAVLTLLYFAQAREVKRLRDWAGAEPERAQESAAAALARSQAPPTGGVRAEPVPSMVTQPVSAAPEVPATALPAAATAAGAGAGVAASSTTAPNGVDTDESVHADDADPAPGTESAPDGAEVPSEADADTETELDTAHDPAVAGSEVRPEAEEVTVTQGDEQPDTEQPVTAPVTATAETAAPEAPSAPTPSSNGAAHPSTPPSTAVPIPAPRRIAPPVPPAQRAAAAAIARPASRPHGSSAAGRRPGAPVSTRARTRSGPVTALAVAGALVTLAVLVFVGTQLFGGAEDPAPRANVVAGQTGASGPAGDGSTSQPPSAAARRAKTQVAVFNGTTTVGLALSMAERLQSRGYPEGAKTGNFAPDPAAPDQLRTTSTVYYAEGERAQARDVGRLLTISELKQIDSDLQNLAPQAKVLVIVGADKTR